MGGSLHICVSQVLEGASLVACWFPGTFPHWPRRPACLLTTEIPDIYIHLSPCSLVLSFSIKDSLFPLQKEQQVLRLRHCPTTGLSPASAVVQGTERITSHWGAGEWHINHTGRAASLERRDKTEGSGLQ